MASRRPIRGRAAKKGNKRKAPDDEASRLETDPFGLQLPACGKTGHGFKPCGNNPHCLMGMEHSGRALAGIWAKEPPFIKQITDTEPRVFNRGAYQFGDDVDEAIVVAQTDLSPVPTTVLSTAEARELHPVGLLNLGATCYLNVLLQLWFFNLRFRRAMYEWEPTAEEQKEFDEVVVSSVVDVDGGDDDAAPVGDAAQERRVAAARAKRQGIPALQRLFANMQLGRKTHTTTREFVKLIGLRPGEQQDPQEAHQVILGYLERLLVGHPAQEKLVPETFEGRQANVLQCCKGHASPSYEVFRELRLPIEKLRTVEEAMAEYFVSEDMTGANQYQCGQCGEAVDATRAVVITKAPLVLNLQLMRFVYKADFSDKRKVQSPIRVPHLLDLPVATDAGSAERTSCKYELVAVLHHKGRSAHSGHYVSDHWDDVRSTWWSADDDNLTETRLVKPPKPAPGGSKPKPKAKSKAPPEDVEVVEIGDDAEVVEVGDDAPADAPAAGPTWAHPSQPHPHLVDRASTTAYMLVYRRVGGLLPEGDIVEPEPPAEALVDVTAKAVEFSQQVADHVKELARRQRCVQYRKAVVQLVLKAMASVGPATPCRPLPTAWLAQWVRGQGDRDPSVNPFKVIDDTPPPKVKPPPADDDIVIVDSDDEAAAAGASAAAAIACDGEGEGEAPPSDEAAPGGDGDDPMGGDEEPSGVLESKASEGTADAGAGAGEVAAADPEPPQDDRTTKTLFQDPIDMTGLLCSHGNISPACLPLVRRIPVPAYDAILSSAWDGMSDIDDGSGAMPAGPIAITGALDSDEFGCTVCWMDSLRDKKQRQDKKESLEEVLYAVVNGEVKAGGPLDYFWVSKAWVSKLRAAARAADGKSGPMDSFVHGGAAASGTIASKVNEDITCEHGALGPQVKRRRRLSTWAWEVIKAKFPDAVEYPKGSPVCAVCSEVAEAQRKESSEARAHAASLRVRLDTLCSSKRGERGYPAVSINADHELVTKGPLPHGMYYAVKRAWVEALRRAIETGNTTAVPLGDDFSTAFACRCSRAGGKTGAAQRCMLPSHTVAFLSAPMSFVMAAAPAEGGGEAGGEDVVDVDAEEVKLEPPALPGYGSLVLPQEHHLLFGTEDVEFVTPMELQALRGLSDKHSSLGLPAALKLHVTKGHWRRFDPPLCAVCMPTQFVDDREARTSFEDKPVTVVLLKPGQAPPVGPAGARVSGRSKRATRTGGQSVELSVSDKATVGLLLMQATANFGVQRRLCLFSEGRALRAAQTLREAGVLAGSTLHCGQPPAASTGVDPTEFVVEDPADVVVDRKPREAERGFTDTVLLA